MSSPRGRSKDDQPSTRPLLDKLGVKPEHRVALLNLDDPDFLFQVMGRAAQVYVNRRRAQLDLIFLGVDRREGLRKLRTQKSFIASGGAIWVVWPKGSRDINENDVRDAALDAGIVDVKVVSFSPTLSALKLVIRVMDR
jgi:hypothetical protein